ncbi:aldolase [Bosea sp. 685]|uniref:aldolase n=1 Tax=Bosea sp. 685 TaxID=3080057 RepID=UPI0028934990|nr:aldolase [Bosea sp. 685]WNJ89253.1 aldolase [Bosea sp. 685]
MSLPMSSPPSITNQRRDLAAALRLAAKFELNEGICNHFSVALPNSPDGKPRYLINPYGVHWSEMKPSDLLLIDDKGEVLEGEGEVEATARNIHVAAHKANLRHVAVLHVHMPYATALTMVEGGRLEMAHQTACRFHGRTHYVDHFGGLALDASEGEAIIAASKAYEHVDITFLAHHGVTIGGPSIAVAFDDLYFLERACRQQVLAMSTGRPLKLIPQQQIEATARDWRDVLVFQSEKHFEALRRIEGA